MNPIDLSIIIVSWNTRALLEACLASIRQHAGGALVEVIVVDNASSDGTQDLLKQNWAAVNLIENDHNAGFARANNQGMAIARGRHVLLLNSDTRVHAGALQAMVQFADAHPKAGVVGCTLLNDDGTLQASWARFPTLGSEVRGKNARARRRLEGEPASVEAYDVDWVGGAAMLIRADTLKQVGGLDEGIFMYTEETDYCYRVRLAGWRVCYLASATITHLGGGSMSRGNLTQLQRLYNSKIYFFRKHYGAPSAFALRLGLAGANAFGLARRGFKLLLKGRRDQEGWARVSTQARLVNHLLLGRE